MGKLCKCSDKAVWQKGVFYEIVGTEVSGLDGFYDKVWDEYGDIGIKIPENPNGVCNELKEKLGMSCLIVDANDLGQELLGCSDDLRESIPAEELIKFVRDNPSGQGKELTPIILIRPLENFEKNGDTLAPGVQA